MASFGQKRGVFCGFIQHFRRFSVSEGVIVFHKPGTFPSPRAREEKY